MAHVLGQIAEVDAEPDHRRLVRHGGHARDGARGDLGVAQVALQPLRAVREIARPLTVRGGQQRVQRPHLVALGEQRVDHVRADEPGAAGHEDHAASLRGSHPVTTGPA